ncbi:hypothetical protein SISNIDRAFT_455411 [Sistotremastrum niveocremeum HHB9708]|uniref:MYND-type domain-containing protein n=1 Tax=Sistotremastrum niveocremeum HHB9708 TaxID=1314777 RepID=A0A164TZS6_9AGAM|nr:hypothetical protein SISNIDRAFT_455411 [Sistotremastrum niveocremeum HHB9708]
MAFYSQSPVAIAPPFHSSSSSYSSGPSLGSHGSKPRGHRVCDTCGAIETAQTGRFRLCGGCMITQYCSPECQKNNWPQHKILCRHTAEQMTASKQHATAVGPSSEFPDPNLAKNLRKFTSAHADLIGWTAFQALQLKRMPINIRQYALQVNLQFRPSNDSASRFTVASVQLVPKSILNDADPVVSEDVSRREERCRRAGGIGVAVVLLQCGLVSQVMPVEVDPPAKIAWDARDDWEQVFRMYTEAGRTDFTAPISRRR